jgi:hypothetical protein
MSLQASKPQLTQEICTSRLTPHHETMKKKNRLKLTALLFFCLALTASGLAVQEDRYMRGGNQPTVNGFQAYNLSLIQSSNFESDLEEAGTGGLPVDWGIRVWRRTSAGTEVEITGGSPVAIVSRSSGGQGIQSATWTPPETQMGKDDSLIVRTYIQVGSGGFSEKAQFTTERLGANRLNAQQWTVNYYTQYETTTRGPPGGRSTTGTFYWGSSTYNSRIENLDYSKASYSVEQVEPTQEENTFSGDSFTHSVNVTCGASSCDNITVEPQINYAPVDGNDLNWSDDQKKVQSLSNGETATKSFEVKAKEPGEYEIRFKVTDQELGTKYTKAEEVDVHEAFVTLDDLRHENEFFQSVGEYETSDTIDFFNTTLLSNEKLYYWLAGTTQPSVSKYENGSWDNLDSRSNSPSFSIYAAASNRDNFYLGGGNGNLVRWQESGFTDISTPFSDQINAMSFGENQMYVGTANPGNYLFNETDDSFKDLGSLPGGATPETVSESYGERIGGEYFLIGTDIWSVVKYQDGSFTEIQPGNIFSDTVAASSSNMTHFLLGDRSGNLGLYNGEGWSDVSSQTGFEGNYQINTIKYGNLSNGNRAFWLIGGGSGHLEKLYTNGTSVDLSGNLPGSWDIYSMDYDPNEEEFLIGGANGNIYRYDESGFTDLTPSGFSNRVRALEYQQGEGGKAYNLTVSPNFLEPDSTVANWGPFSTKYCGNISRGSSCNQQFNNYDVPINAESGEYLFDVSFDWENGGPAYNKSFNFDVVDVQGTFSSSLQSTQIPVGSKTEYSFNLTNKWSTNLTDVNITVNCPQQLNCTGKDKNYWNQISSSEQVQSNFEINTTESTPTGFYDINISVNYSNPRENKTWDQVSNRQLQVITADALRTTIKPLPEKITRGNTEELKGYLYNRGSEAQDVYLNWSLEQGWSNFTGKLNKFNETVSSDTKYWNNITAYVGLQADRGETYVNLSSSSKEDRGTLTFQKLDVYADTTVNLDLNRSDVGRGQKVRAEVDLELDTGSALSGDVVIKDSYSGEVLDVVTTGPLMGTALSEFKIPEDWNITEHNIVASYGGNNDIHTNPSEDTVPLDVHDYPDVTSVNEEPDLTGFGGDVKVNATVEDKDLVSETYLNLTYPDGTKESFMMKEGGSQVYEYNFSETLQNGEYSYFITAYDTAGYSGKSSERSFQVNADLEMDVTTEKDEYGPSQTVWLNRSRNVTRNASMTFDTVTREQYAEKLFSNSFNTITGSSSLHTDTHEKDGSFFEMTERGGQPPSTPDEFEGVYTYETSLTDLRRIDIDSFGNVSSGTWDVYARNYNTDSWSNLYSISSTTPVWDNHTICSGSTCNDFIRNGEIKIRVFETSSRGNAATYSVDFQKLRIETSDGPISEKERPEQIRVGKDSKYTRRYYRKINLTELPYYQSAEIESARLVFNVSSGFGTGTIYHTKNFTSVDQASTIHADGAPSEANQSNPIASFSTSEGIKNVSVTEALNSSFEAGKRFVGFQFREEGENLFYNISSPIYLRVKYKSDSSLIDTGNTEVTGYLNMRVQSRTEGGGWDNTGFPVVDSGDSNYTLKPGESLNLSKIWEDAGGWSTGIRTPGRYRVLSRFVDSGGNTLETNSGDPIRDSYEFEILKAELNLTDIEHENKEEYSVNEYGTGDVLEWTNVTVNNSRTEAADVAIDLNVIRGEQQADWGPDSLKQCGDVEAGGSCEKRWDNQSQGYMIPEDASSGSFQFNWNTTITAENAETVRNSSFNFIVHDVPGDFSSLIDDSDNKIYRNESTLYNFTVRNPWSEPLEGLNVTVNCDLSNLVCEDLSGSGSTVNVGSLGSGSSQQVSFNISTNESTPTGDYDLNATVEYVNPGNEEKRWTEQENEILGVRIPGALLNITEAPLEVTRGTGGYSFESKANNTFSEDLTNEWVNWTVPGSWQNTTGDLNVFEDVHSPGEIVYNNFTASVGSDASLGEKRINISVTNDQGRVDSDFVYVDVYADTQMNLKLNDSSPAVNQSLKMTGELLYSNGTPIRNQQITFRDETAGLTIDTGFTNSTGEYTTEYQVDGPLGNHLLNASFPGSNEEYLRPSEDTKQVSVTDIPTVGNLSATPNPVGIGKSVNLTGDVQDADGIDDVDINITYPNGTEIQQNMTQLSSGTWSYLFGETWKSGEYSYSVIAEDVEANKGSNSSNFTVESSQSSTIQTIFDSYSPAENVELTEYGGGWWNTSWDFRRRIEVNETSGSDLKKYPTRIEVNNLGEATSNCEDLRLLEGFQLIDLYVQSCNPSGTTVIYGSQNITASSSQRELYLYYGNSNASAYGDETYAYPIDDSGVYDPGSSSISNTYSYNDGDSVFRQAEITVFGNNLQAEVTAAYVQNSSQKTLYSGAASGGQTIVNSDYLQNPLYNSINVQLENTGGGNTGDVRFEYNFTTPSRTSTAVEQERDRLPSIINNTGITDIRGELRLQVSTNRSGDWKQVSTVYNDSSPRLIESGGGLNYGTIWNSDPWYTDQREEGYYRAEFDLLSPSGEVLSTSEENISAKEVFKLNPPQTDVQVEEIDIYNVSSSSSPKTDTSELEASGSNTTFTIKGGESYRFDVVVNNSETAEAVWEIQQEDNISYFNFNSTWTVSSSEIFYKNGTRTFTGGSFDGNVSWDTSGGGKVRPGDNATFSFVIDIPNRGEERDIEFLIDTLSFTTEDLSDLEIVEKEQEPPKPLLFDLNSSIIKGEQLEAYAKWNEQIKEAKAEYNATSSALFNETVVPEGQWTNFTTSTDKDWKKGTHSFQFYAYDFNDNQNSTETKYFDVFDLASVNQSELNQSEALPGEEVEFACQVTDQNSDPVSNYNVSFYNETSKFAQASTGPQGWANVTYSSDQIGYQTLECNITSDESRYYKVGDGEGNETLRVAEEEPPEYQEYGANVSRVFKTTENTTANIFSRWTDNRELDYASLNESGLNPTGDLPGSFGNLLQLEGTDDWANFSYNPDSEAKLRDQNWSVYVNDTSSNVNQTREIPVDIWAWAYNSPDNSGPDKNPVSTGEEFTFFCQYVQGNASAIENYDVNFYDNSTQDGSWQYLGTNQTQTGSLSGFAQWSKSYGSTGSYDFKCNITSSSDRNIKPRADFKSYSEVINVEEGTLEPPKILDDNYGLNISEIYRGEDLLSFAQWDEQIESAEIEFNSTNSSLELKNISEPYTDEWTNYTLDTNSSWKVGPHVAKTYATDADGNENDTLEYLDFDVYGKAEVQWLEPTGTVQTGINDLKCGVYSIKTSEPIEGYSVSFYDETEFIGSNTTGSDGEAIYSYDTTGDSTGEQTWSCRIEDEPSLYYNASVNDTDSETVNLVDQVNASVSGNLTQPKEGAVLAQNKTFDANVTIKCSNGDCGDVNASLRYNSSGLEPDTTVPEASGEPFHTVGSNKKSCDLNQGENCTVSFDVKASGQQNEAYALDSILESDNAQTNDTENVNVTIDVVLITSFNYSEVNFDSTPPDETVAAPGNTAGNYSFSLSENSNDADGVWIKMTNLSQVDGSYEIRPKYTKWSLKPPCSLSGAYNMTRGYSEVVDTLNAGESITQCYWQEIPFAKRSGNYLGTMSIKVNTTE